MEDGTKISSLFFFQNTKKNLQLELKFLDVISCPIAFKSLNVEHLQLPKLSLSSSIFK